MTTVAIVEDSQDIRLLTTEALVRQGYCVTTIPSAHPCEVGLWTGVDAALVELHLDGPLDGRDVLAWLQATLPGIRRIAHTAAVFSPEYPSPVEDGLADALLEKPYDLSVLMAVLG